METQEDINQRQTANSQLKAMQKDLITEVEKYPSITIAYKSISAGTGLSVRTLQRITKGTTCPSFHTALKFYRFIFGTSNERDTLLLMPKVFQTDIIQNHENYSLTPNEVTLSSDIDTLLCNDSIFRFIYIHTAAGKISKEKVGYEYGRQGLNVLKKMLQLSIITESEPGYFSQGKKRAVLNPESLYSIGKQLLENHYYMNKAESTGENAATLLIESVDLDGYNEILKFEWKTKQERQKLLKSLNKGPVKFWTIHFTDTLSSEHLYSDNSGVIQ